MLEETITAETLNIDEAEEGVVTWAALVAALLESRRFIASMALAGALSALVGVTLIGTRYTATAMFVPETGSDAEISSLMGIAGQFGLPIGRSSSTPSPDLYALLATSRTILWPIVTETLPADVHPTGGRSAIADLLVVNEVDSVRRDERAVERLQEGLSARYDRRTGAITLSVRTRWRAISLRVGQRILEQLNEFNLRTRQSRAKAERVFAEARTTEARNRVRGAEEEMERFSLRNRVVSESPTLQLQRDRLEREIALLQQLLSSLEQSLEKARLREVQDTPVITVLQAPTTLSVPDPRGRIRFSMLGAMMGVLLSLIILPLRHAVARGHREKNPDVERLMTAVQATTGDLARLIPRRNRKAPGVR